MTLKDHDEIESESDRSKEDEKPPLKGYNDEDVEYLVEGESLVIRSAFKVQIKEYDVEQQRKNIFHTRCHIHNKVYSMIIYEVVVLMFSVLLLLGN
jgi:hypothetical protein